jgi:hypothetical protein
MAELVVLVHDSNSKQFRREWSETANRLDAIRWTIEDDDLPYYVSVENICNIQVWLKNSDNKGDK